ncbi:putative tail fiber protein [Klebsiella phage KPN8]|nr:putative tail fiber protein [Klebsiella phage KPN8]
MTTPTQLPIPSSNLLDSRFNFEKLDQIVNSDADFYLDRFGKQRLTVLGATNQLIQSLKDQTGANNVTYVKSKVDKVLSSIGYSLDVIPMNIFDKAYLCSGTDNPDPNTWIWTAALQGVLSDIASYKLFTLNGNDYYTTFSLRIPGGVYQIDDLVSLGKVAGTGGGASFRTNIVINGDGKSSSVLRLIGDDKQLFKFTESRLVMRDIGLQTNGARNIGMELGDQNNWVPMAHSHLDNVSITGFCRGLLISHCFDSTFDSLFISEIADTGNAVIPATGIEIAQFLGKDSSNNPDNSNQLTFINCVVETARTDNAILFYVNGISKSYPHHAINFLGGHLETHRRNTVCYKFNNMALSTFTGVTFSQNGTDSTNPVNVGVITDSWNIIFNGGRTVTNNAKNTYDDTWDKLITVAGSSMGITYMNHHFITPYQTYSSYNRNANTVFNFTGATAGINAIDADRCRLNDFTFKPFTKSIEITRMDLITQRFRISVNTSGSLVFAYSNDVTGAAAMTDLVTITNTGNATFLGSVTATNVTGTSDERLKTEIGEVDQVLIDVVKSLRPKKYRLKNDPQNKIRVGFIAQDLIELMDKAGLDFKKYSIIAEFNIPGDDSENTYYSLDYDEIMLLRSL